MTENHNRRWYHITPDRFLIGLLGVLVLLWLSEWFGWFPLNDRKGYTVLIAVATTAGGLLLMVAWFVLALLFRRKFQFGIRSLLVLVVIVAIPSSWFSVKMRAAQRQREAVESINDRGPVWIDYDRGFGNGSIGIGLIYNSVPPDPPWPRRVLGDDFFRDVVKIVFVSSQDFSDNDVRHLKSLPKLEALVLYDCDCSDASLENLKGLTNLRTVFLDNAPVTDDGLRHLKRLKNLDYLGLMNTQVTDEGARELRRALPNCEIEYEPAEQ